MEEEGRSRSMPSGLMRTSLGAVLGGLLQLHPQHRAGGVEAHSQDDLGGEKFVNGVGGGVKAQDPLQAALAVVEGKDLGSHGVGQLLDGKGLLVGEAGETATATASLPWRAAADSRPLAQRTAASW